MSNELQQAHLTIRASVTDDRHVRLFARAHKVELGPGWSFDIAEPSATGAETLLGVLASDVMCVFARLAKQKRVIVDEMEATVSADLLDPLVHLGVIGASGEPRYENFVLRAYVGTSAAESTVRALWDESLARAPLYNTLRHAAQVRAELILTH
ncbi:MAG: OsmC family protein [Verrucomicrobiaceae bacterium]|nr:OsmC family protein [Verrucomicrobiaceae bacterium]